MEWDKLDEALPDEITKFDQGHVARLRHQLINHSHYFNHHVNSHHGAQMLKSIIDELGVRSGRAQGLGHSITSFDKFSYGDRHVIYILRDKPPPRVSTPNKEEGEHEEREVVEEKRKPGHVYGFIKIGHKPLFVMDLNGSQLEEKTNKAHLKVNPLCVLDFYVLESHQRNGFGKKLFEYMIRDQGANPAQLAIDRPSPKFKSFLRKHYGLVKNIPQINNFVIFEGFFKFNQVRRNRNRLIDDFQDRRAKSNYLERRQPRAINRIHSEPVRHREPPSVNLPSVKPSTPVLPAIEKPSSIMSAPRSEPRRETTHTDNAYAKYTSQWTLPKSRTNLRSQHRK